MTVAAIAEWLLTSKLGRALILAVLALAAFAWWSAHMEAAGARRERDKQAAATAKEIARLQTELGDMQRKWQAVDADNRKKDVQNERLRLVANDAGARLRGRVCVDADIVDRMRQLQ